MGAQRSSYHSEFIMNLICHSQNPSYQTILRKQILVYSTPVDSTPCVSFHHLNMYCLENMDYSLENMAYWNPSSDKSVFYETIFTALVCSV